MTLGELFSHNYQYLALVAKRITRRKNIKLANDLINQTYLDIHDKEYPKNGDEFIKWFSKCMKNRYVWKNSNFNKNTQLIAGNELPEQSDPTAQADIELSTEETNDTTKELIEVSSGMKKERVLKYIEVIEFKKSLPLHEQYLFDLYFNNDLSTRKISKQLSEETGYDMHFKRINSMVNEIKAKIKLKWK